MSSGASRMVVLGLLALTACGGAGPATAPAPAFTVRGVGVVVRTAAPFAARPDFPARVESTLEAALAYWGGGWDRLGGVTIDFEGTAHVACAGASAAIGCFDGDIRVSTQDPTVELTCVEQTALVHEVGHAVIGDAAHADPRWMDFTPVAEALAGRPGYAAGGDAPCPIYLSLWRHPPPSQ